MTIQGGASDASLSLRSAAADWIVTAAPTSLRDRRQHGDADDHLFDLSSAAAAIRSSGRWTVPAGLRWILERRIRRMVSTSREPGTRDLFSDMGPDLIDGPDFNYGCAGASFGRSAGFFNVRPDALAVAPKPSLRFFTSNQARMIIDNQAFVGLSGSGGNAAFFDPVHPLQMASGAHVTAGGVWTNASSRALKNSIESLSPLVAMVALEQLEPVRYCYNADSEDEHLGFVAEDVPALVATPDRKGLAPMDVVSLLTKVVQV
ncbi:MAG: tail fiber domain-containing protein, partial [Acidobacteriota bacterium]